MKPEAQRIAIAKACGYLNPREINPGSFVASAGMNSQGEYWGTRGIPDYLNDLNAMHEGEKLLTDERCQRQFDNLSNVTGARLETLGTQYGVCHFMMYNATAAQRAEAFLKTLNLWTDDN